MAADRAAHTKETLKKGSSWYNLRPVLGCAN